MFQQLRFESRIPLALAVGVCQANREIIGVATTLPKAIKIVKAQAEQERVKLSKYTLEFLTTKLQTQDYGGDGEFVIEEYETNKLL